MCKIYDKIDKNKVIFEITAGSIGKGIEVAVKQGISLAHADLRHIDLDNRDLSGGEFTSADFRNSRLSRTDFRGANLWDAEFHGANMHGMDIRGAGIDFTSWPLWCGSVGVIVDEKQARQILAHAFNATKAFWPGGLTDEQKGWLNLFHRISEGEFPEFR